jgi:hypothetical protein
MVILTADHWETIWARFIKAESDYVTACTQKLPRKHRIAARLRLAKAKKAVRFAAPELSKELFDK